MKKDFSNTLKQWYNGELNLDKEISQGKEPVAPTEVITPKKKIEIIPSIEKKELQLSSKLYKTLGVVFCIILSIFLIGVVNFLPLFARSNTPTDNEVSHHSVADGRDETGAVNTVAGMILDYLAFDTLGESFVLFTATCAVLLLLEQSENNEKKEVIKTIYGFNSIETFNKLYDKIESHYFDELNETIKLYKETHVIVDDELNESVNNLPASIYHLVARDMLNKFINDDKKKGINSLPVSIRDMISNMISFLKSFVCSENNNLSKEEIEYYRNLINNSDFLISERIPLQCYKF